MSRSNGDAAFYDDYRALTRFSSLDGVRFFCIAAVLWQHAPGVDLSADWPLFAKRGFLGVDFFFVISGFLITTLLLREESRAGQFSLKAFYWRRFLRIIPVYFLIVTVVSVYYIWIKGETQYGPIVPYYYIFFSNFLVTEIPLLGPTWSLAVEEQFYVVWPLLLLLVPRRLIMSVLVVLIAVNVAAGMGLFSLIGINAYETEYLRFALPNSTYAPILMGAGLAMLLHKRESFEIIVRLLGQVWAPIVSIIVLIALLQLLPDDLRGWPNFVLHLSMTVCLATLVVRDDHVLRGFLTWRPIVRFGEISYGIYLYHLFALHIGTVTLAQFGVESIWMSAVIYLCGSYVISEISFRTFERYFLSFKHHVPGSKHRKEPAS